jgi:midasin
MDELDVRKGQQAVLQDAAVLEQLPEELLHVIQSGERARFLDAVAAASLTPVLTTRFFARFERVFADTCSRWISNPRCERRVVIESFARILPFAPHLSAYLDKYLRNDTATGHERFNDLVFPYLSEGSQDGAATLSVLDLQRILLASWRLLSLDKRKYGATLSLAIMQSLLRHECRPVRYLAVRIYSQLLSASDYRLEELMNEFVGKEEAVMGDFDGAAVDYGFLDIYEKNRRKEVEDMRYALQEQSGVAETLTLAGWSPLVARYGCVLLPRPDGQPLRQSALIRTPTTARNMEAMATALTQSSPILVHGLSGCGKTSLINDFARELGKDSAMVTLHLNEQTDAKVLIGMYATGSTPGSFSWRPGVLTTAVREGRWVFIEDLDRAPNEVISVILPLIERNELLIPSRGETVRAAPGFRLIASIRTSVNMAGQEIAPAMHMLGARLWNRVPIAMPVQDEFREIIQATHPVLHKYIPIIISVYERLQAMSRESAFTSKARGSVSRPISPRELLKWCSRLNVLLEAAGCRTGEEAVSEATRDEMFMEAVDCFSGSFQSAEARKSVISCIAQEMHMPFQKVEHYLEAYVPAYTEEGDSLKVGRVRLAKKKNLDRISKSLKKQRPFAQTTHAKRLLEQVGAALRMAEPVLLVGETGIGKTTVIQQLADSLGYKLTAVNLSQQSESGDLLGGFKPVNVRSLAMPLKDEFDDLFSRTGISATRNQKYLDQLGKAVAKGQWTRASKLWREAPRMFEKILADLQKLDAAKVKDDSTQPTKKRKTESKLEVLTNLKPRWEQFSRNLDQFDVQLSGGSKGFTFTFVEGNIIKAARNGDWVLLDEINLASPDTLEAIADLLHSGAGSRPSILLSETGEIERVYAHPDFRIFGAMNPATDVGKRDLPIGLRSRFTEIYVESPDRNRNDLLAVIKAYLKMTSSQDDKVANDVASLYMETKRRAEDRELVDGANQVPHFSLRTLTRVLGYVSEIAPSYGLRRALYEGYAMGFLTLLNGESERLLMPLIHHYLLDSHKNAQSLLSQTPKHPEDGRKYVRFMNKKRDRQYWMLQGREKPEEQPHYIITPFVERNMLNLVRATSTRKFPVLVQGPTSAGKTSMIEYLAKFSGNKFVRINNHEHTDLQEYLGTYVSGADGQLRFQEGLLVQALREGHWIVLDELNLAPTDVLEALNRLLDDNRELFIPETQEVVRPHENFMLFATQNPPGLYGGRKTLSRAFRNRFLELHFDDIPEDELEFILQHRAQKVAPSDCKRIVTVYKELSRLRQTNRLFEQKDSFATLRDLFRWALRDADNRQQLAANGYMLLAERVRKPEERDAVKAVIESVMKVKIDPRELYSENSSPEIKLYDEFVEESDEYFDNDIVWTAAMRRLYVLVSHAIRNNEPVLLVGETGCGKTTVCQMLAKAFKKELHTVNAHQNTETGDLIGAQRPVRNRAAILMQVEDNVRSALAQASRMVDDGVDASLDTLLEIYDGLSDADKSGVPIELQERILAGRTRAKALFEWSDGTLVQAMKEGQYFLLDEISLADDSVLERLNSVLESQRTILLAEKGAEGSFVEAADGFQFFATMNPGGDYGKRELSPALRNRFTEIWVPALSAKEDILQIVEEKLRGGAEGAEDRIVDFAIWFGETYRPSSAQKVSIRDILAWIDYLNKDGENTGYFALVHGAAMVYIDTLGANPAALLAINPETVAEERARCVRKLGDLFGEDLGALYYAKLNIEVKDDRLELDYETPESLIDEDDPKLWVDSFSLQRSKHAATQVDFAFQAPTTKNNAMRIVRALQVKKPILIEGSPGVGKTTLVTALAKAAGVPLTRINLSDQTDLMDLFGSDVPVEGAEAGNFAWRDAPFLQAMQKGEWVLLDEMNLASQSVLEGLNACLDHRGEVYISELDQTFKRHPDFCVFAAQNPHHQGGGRKGLPSSFVNRFTVVYADTFKDEDLRLICRHIFPQMNDEVMSNVIDFVSALEKEVVYRRKFGLQGGPWEFNLRDTLRWLQLLASQEPLLTQRSPADFLGIIFRQRFRTAKDREALDALFARVFGSEPPFRHYFHTLSEKFYQVGIACLGRNLNTQHVPFPSVGPVARLAELESIIMCVEKNLPCILVGPSGSGKTSLVQHVAAAAGAELVTFPMNADIDTMDLVGGYEQVDPHRAAGEFAQKLRAFFHDRVLQSATALVPAEVFEVVRLSGLPEASHPSGLQIIGKQLAILQEKTSMPGILEMVQMCQSLSEQSTDNNNARFEWVDGVLIKALEQGKWLVLDNANLCSSSVLDRLNSLLEPNGVLSISEHCEKNGEPKVVKPHANFRLFITMDPRYGELSRAMRNRGIELFIDNLSESPTSQKPVSNTALQRYALVSEAFNKSLSDMTPHYSSVAMDYLLLNDLQLLSRFAQSAQRGLTTQLSPDLHKLMQRYLKIFSSEYGNLWFSGKVYEQDSMERSLSDFRDAQVSDRAVLSLIVYVLIVAMKYVDLTSASELSTGIHEAIILPTANELARRALRAAAGSSCCA